MDKFLEKGDSYTINVTAVSGEGHLVEGNTIDIAGVKVFQMIPTPPAELLPELWKVPPKNNNFIGRSELLKQIDYYSQRNAPVILTAFHGLGGVGKTQVALEFVWQHYKDYKGVVWFDAENQDRLQNDYISLGRELNIIRDNESIDTKELARYVKHWLENPLRAGWLLVYDNAPNYEAIRELLPIKEGKLLVTSRYAADWPQENINVDVFTIEESRVYVRKVLDNLLSESDRIQIDTLAKALGRLPLALAIACAYIKKNKLSILEYLELYRLKKEYILSVKKWLKSDQLLRNSDEEAQFTSVYITWDITMDEIHRDSLLAANWLNVCACLASNGIPHFLFSEFAKTPENNPESEIFKEALGTLYSYSMLAINEQNKSSSIHNLVQEVIRLKWGATEKEKNLRATFQLLKNNFPYLSREGENETATAHYKRRHLLPHLEAFLPCLEIWQQEASPELVKEIENNYLESILSSIAVGYWNLGDAQKESKFWERVLAIKERHYGPDHMEVAIILTNLGDAYNALGNAQKAKELLERALTIKERNYGNDHIEVSITLMNLGFAYGALGDAQKKRELYERALATNELYYGPDHIEVAITLTNLGEAYSAIGDEQKAKEMQERALRIKEHYYGPDHVEVAITLTNLGKAYRVLGNAQKAKELLERALTIKEHYYGFDNVEVSVTLTNLGNAYGDLGETQKKRELLERALTIKEKYYGRDHAEVATTLTNLGDAYTALQDTQKANELLERALIINKRYYGPDHVKVAVTLTSLGILYSALGDAQKANELLERAWTIKERYYGPDHVEVATTLASLGDTYRALRNAQKAKELLERALAIKERYYGPNHVELANTLINLGNTHGVLGDIQKKHELQKRALTINECYLDLSDGKVAASLPNFDEVEGVLGDTRGASNE